MPFEALTEPPFCYSPGRMLGGEGWGITPEEAWGLL
jgi:hypothetical protein